MRLTKEQQEINAKHPHGIFLGEPRVLLLPDGEKIQLLGNMIFIDPAGQHWILQKGEISDGASIPRLLWSVAGAPLCGKFRVAAMFHDKYCTTKERSWRDTHWMFLDAMLASGVEAFEAETKYIAVYRFGPRW